MSNVFIISIVVLCVCIVISRIMSEKGLKTLSPEQKVSLLDEFSNQRKYSFIPIILILIVYIVVVHFFPEQSVTLYLVFIFCLLAYLVIMNIVTSKKLKKLGLPKSCLKLYLASRFVYYFGLVIFLGSIIIDIL